MECALLPRHRLPIGLLLAATVTLGVPAPAFAIPGLGLVGSAAAPRTFASLFTNPAGIGSQPGQSVFFAPPAGTGSSAALFANWDGLSLGLSQGAQIGVPSPSQNAILSLGNGGQIFPGVRFGYAVKYGLGWDWDVGLMYRPFEFLSIGASGLNLSQGDGYGRIWDVGLAVRPFTDRITLSADTLFTGLAQPQLAVGVDVTPVDGVTVRGWAMPDLVDGTVPLGETIGVGLALRVPEYEIGGMAGPLPGGYVAFQQARQPSILMHHGTAVAVLDLSQGLAPAVASLLPQVVQRPAVSYPLQAIAQAANDPEVGGLAVDVGAWDGSMPDAEEVRDALVRFRATGKRVVCYLADASPVGYYLALAADRIVLNPISSLDVSGFHQDFTFLAGTFRKLGVKWDVVAQGRYKTAPQEYTMTHMSAANHEQYQAYLDDEYRRFTDAIATDRKLAPTKVKALVDQGVFSAQQAMQAGLVDAVGYPDQVVRETATLLGEQQAPTFVAGDRLYAGDRWTAPPAIAVVLVKGEIAGGESRTPLLTGPVAGARTVAQAIHDAREEGAKAIVLRVESPGGDVTAAEDIHRQVVLAEQAHIPVVVSMGDLAASGGYWISAPADRIFADGTTLTGSIGVFAMKPVLAGLYGKLGANVDTLQDGPNSTLDSSFQRWTPAQRALVQAQTEATYREFVKRVAAGRHMGVNDVVKIAGGHVWSGDDAKRLGLVDEIGGLAQALAWAKQAAGLSDGVRIDFFPVTVPFGLGGIQARVMGQDGAVLQGLKDQAAELKGLAKTQVHYEALPPGVTP